MTGNQAGSIFIGDRVRWESAEGTIRGAIKDIRLMMNAELKLTAWIVVEYIRDNRETLACICGTDDNLKMLKFQVNFRG